MKKHKIISIVGIVIFVGTIVSMAMKAAKKDVATTHIIGKTDSPTYDNIS